MKTNPKVSVVIPVYNGIKFIDKCVQSVLNQSYKNIEIVLSNDGSTDNSLKLIKDYTKKYKNIKYDTHDNVGLSITRNIAMKNVSGDYVTYLDVDDYLDTDFIEKMICVENDYDIIIGGYRSVDSSGKIEFEYSVSNSTWNRYKRATVWAKLYKVSFLKENNITYPNIRIYCEDVVYTMRCLSKTDNVIIKSYIGYNNLVNFDSITHTDSHKIINDIPKALVHIDNFIFGNKDYLRNNENIVKYYYLKMISAYLIDIAKFTQTSDLLKYFHTNRDTINSYFKKYEYNNRIKWINDEKTSVNILIKLLLFFEKIGKVDFLIKMISKKYFRSKD